MAMLNEERERADKALRLNGFVPEYNSPIPLPEIKPTLRIRRLVNPIRPKIKALLQVHLHQISKDN